MSKTTAIAVTVATVLAMSTLVLLFLAGLVDSRSFGFGGLAVMTIGAVAWYLLFKRERARSDGSKPSVLAVSPISANAKRVRVAIILLWFLIATWDTRHEPWPPRLVGSFFLGLILIGTLLRKTTDTK
jgi:hypothetical protein